MKIKDLREILLHYEGKEYDNWKIELWDYNHQRPVEWESGMYSSSKDNKTITFPVSVEPVDGETIDKRLRRLIDEFNKNKKS